MKTLRTARLWFKEGSSDKLYDVDLVENDGLSDDRRFLVNIRYGRRGSTLREGSKTAAPVAREAADRIFDSVVVAKVNEGYRRLDQPAVEAAAGDGAVQASGRDAELLARLAACLRNPWPAKDLDRLVWRIGQVRIAPAAPALVAIATRHGAAEASYALVWAVARVCGPAAAPVLAEVAARATSPVTRDLARFALLSPLMGRRAECPATNLT